MGELPEGVGVLDRGGQRGKIGTTVIASSIKHNKNYMEFPTAVKTREKS